MVLTHLNLQLLSNDIQSSTSMSVSQTTTCQQNTKSLNKVITGFLSRSSKTYWHECLSDNNMRAQYIVGQQGHIGCTTQCWWLNTQTQTSTMLSMQCSNLRQVISFFSVVSKRKKQANLDMQLFLQLCISLMQTIKTTIGK